jgi:hypothetical protein
MFCTMIDSPRLAVAPDPADNDHAFLEYIQTGVFMSDSVPILEYTQPATSPRFLVEQTDGGATITLPATPHWQTETIAVGAAAILLILTASSVAAVVDLIETPRSFLFTNILRYVLLPLVFWFLIAVLMRVIFKRRGMQTILSVANGKLVTITPQLIILRREIPLQSGVRLRAQGIVATTLNLQPAGRLVISRPHPFNLYLLRGMSVRELETIASVLNDAIDKNRPAMIPDAGIAGQSEFSMICARDLRPE